MVRPLLNPLFSILSYSFFAFSPRLLLFSVSVFRFRLFSLYFSALHPPRASSLVIVIGETISPRNQLKVKVYASWHKPSRIMWAMNHMRLLGPWSATCNAVFAEKKPIQLASRCAAHDDGLICIVQNDVYRDLREAQSSPGVLA